MNETLVQLDFSLDRRLRLSTTASRAETANPGGAQRSHEEATKWVEEQVKVVSELLGFPSTELFHL